MTTLVRCTESPDGCPDPGGTPKCSECRRFPEVRTIDTMIGVPPITVERVGRGPEGQDLWECTGCGALLREGRLEAHARFHRTVSLAGLF